MCMLFFLSCQQKIAYVDKSVLLSNTNISKQARDGLQTKIEEHQKEMKKQTITE